MTAWLDENRAVCFALDKKYVIQALLSSPIKYRVIFDFDFVKQRQPLLPLTAHESGNVYYADHRVSTDTLIELSNLV